MNFFSLTNSIIAIDRFRISEGRDEGRDEGRILEVKRAGKWCQEEIFIEADWDQNHKYHTANQTH